MSTIIEVFRYLLLTHYLTRNSKTRLYTHSAYAPWSLLTAKLSKSSIAMSPSGCDSYIVAFPTYSAWPLYQWRHQLANSSDSNAEAHTGSMTYIARCFAVATKLTYLVPPSTPSFQLKFLTNKRKQPSPKVRCTSSSTQA